MQPMGATDSQIVAAAIRYMGVLEASVSRRSDGRHDLNVKPTRNATWKTIATGTKDYLLAWVRQHNAELVADVEDGRTIAKGNA
jgi:hypothetical protein